MIKKIPIDNYIDIDLEETDICEVCKSVNRVPCDHKRISFRKKDRIDFISEAINEIIDYINDK